MTAITRNVYIDGQRIPVVERDPSIAASPRNCHTGANPASVSTDGTDATPVVTEMYMAEVAVPFLTTVTGIAVFNGSVASGNIQIGLFDVNGYLLGTTASTAMSGTDAYQSVALSSTVSIPAGTYYVGVQIDNTTARFNTHTLGKFGAGKITGGTYGTFNKVTVPTTFTTALGPIASLY
jgi:hypothetical protein